jgi:DinB superfamily
MMFGARPRLDCDESALRGIGRRSARVAQAARRFCPADRDAVWRPTLDAVLAVRRRRNAMVGAVIESLTDEQLASQASRTEPGWPQIDEFPFKECLLIVLNEEWEHRRYAEGDRAALGAPAAR